MASDSSDKLMFILAIVAVVVSGILFFSSSGILAPLGVTGYATTGVGNVSVNVSSVSSIKMVLNNISFGTGAIAVNGSNGVILESNVTDGLAAGIATFNRSNSTLNPAGDLRKVGGIVIENDGNSDVTLTVASDFANVNNFICGGTIPLGCDLGSFSPQFQLAWYNNATAGNACPSPGWVQGQWTSVTSAGGNTPCTSFESDTNDRLEFHARMRMNEQTPGGSKSARLTFTAS